MPGAIELDCHEMNILDTYLLEQYAYRHDGTEICVKNGDVVIDCGGCWGDTALYFADRVGSAGAVYSFEFLPDNLAVFRDNLDLNPVLVTDL